MFLKDIDLTTALRPSYLPDEDLLFVQDNVGLYEGFVHLVPFQLLLFSQVSTDVPLPLLLVAESTSCPASRMARST